MRCKVCGKKITMGKNLRKGKICYACCFHLPYYVKQHIQNYTAAEIRNLKSVIVKDYERSFVYFDHFHVSLNTVGFDDWAVNYRNIRRVRLNLHLAEPENTSKSYVKAHLYIEITTKYPELTLEELVDDRIFTIPFETISSVRRYHYPESIELILRAINNAIEKDEADLFHVRDCVYRYDEKMKRRREYERKREEKHRQQEEYQQKQRGEKQKKENRKDYAFESINRIFQMNRPFTMSQLRRRHMALMKQYHPDVCGSSEMAVKVNQDYDLLKKYVSVS